MVSIKKVIFETKKPLDNMKNLLLIPILFLSFGVYSQHKTISLQSENLKGRVQSYAKKTFVSAKNSNDFLLKYNVTYFFNKKGNIVRVENYRENNKLDSKEVFEYKNDKISKHNLLNNTGIIGKKTLFDYDSNGNLASQKKYNSQDKLQYDTSYLYNQKGQLTTQQKLIPSINYTMKEDYTYDDFNNLIVRKKTARIGTTKETFRYNSDGLPIKKSEYNAMGELFSVIDYEYNKQNDKTSLKKYDANNSLNYYESYEYVYDANGNWTEKNSFEKGKKVSQEKRTISYF